MKKKIICLAIIAMGFVAWGLSCGGCLSPKAESKSEAVAESTSEAVAEAESSAEAKLDNKIGNVSNESTNALKTDLTSSVEVKGVEVEVVNESAPAPEPEFTFPQLLWNIYQDPFAKKAIVILVNCFLTIVVSAVVGGFVFLFLWGTGNLNPGEKFSLGDKKMPEIITTAIDALDTEKIVEELKDKDLT